MAFSATLGCSYSLCRLSNNSTISSSLSFRSSPLIFNRKKSLSIRSATLEAAPASGGVAPAVSLTDNALKHLNKMRSERNEDLCLRIGVKQGGCSGMSYTMEFENRENARPDDSIIEYNGFVIAAPASGGVAPAVSLTDNALKHLNKMRSERNEDLCLRIGVKQGGCSGMSYTMEFENRENARPDDSIIEYNGFVIVCDPKSLLFIFGMQLDYSDALIGGGFSFKNPNATQTCGCGKSFTAEM